MGSNIVHAYSALGRHVAHTYQRRVAHVYQRHVAHTHQRHVAHTYQGRMEHTKHERPCVHICVHMCTCGGTMLTYVYMRRHIWMEVHMSGNTKPNPNPNPFT